MPSAQVRRRRAHLSAARAGILEALIDQLRLRRLVALTSATEQELPGLVASCDLLVAMTRSDSTPASLLEAMASGLPAVCARAASVGEWLDHREGGLLVPQADEQALSAAISELLAGPELRRRYGEHNRRIVTARVPPPGPQLERLYRRLLHERGSLQHREVHPARPADPLPQRRQGASRVSTS
jgi:glycosyltransferase involved in cell wall biosynthesis